MSRTYSRIAGRLMVLSALFGIFLLIAGVANRPTFDRVILELALIAPLAIWRVSSRLRLRH